MSISPLTSLANIILEHPGAARLFERLGLDYCCGGKLSLARACERAGLNVDEVIAQIGEQYQAVPAQDWNEASLNGLIDHILSVHHDFEHEEMPRLKALADKVSRVHGDRHPELVELADVYTALMDELGPHLMKEEQVLFPYIRGLESDKEASDSCFGSVENPIRMMNMEHEHAGELLRQLRVLSDGFTPPADACGSYRALFHGLAELEHDLMSHIHLEANVLFPRAIAQEAGGCGCC